MFKPIALLLPITMEKYVITASPHSLVCILVMARRVHKDSSVLPSDTVGDIITSAHSPKTALARSIHYYIPPTAVVGSDTNNLIRPSNTSQGVAQLVLGETQFSLLGN